jgi:hypothetical protein
MALYLRMQQSRIAESWHKVVATVDTSARINRQRTLEIFRVVREPNNLQSSDKLC